MVRILPGIRYLNISVNRNRIESLNNAQINSYMQDAFIVGKPAGTVKGYIVDHIVQNMDEVNELNARQKLTDKSGKEAEPISWECGLYGEKMRGMCDANQWSARTCLFYIFAISKGKSNCTGTFE